MLRFTTFLLAEAATVDNGLLSMLHGGVNQLRRAALPAPLGLHLVCILESENRPPSEQINLVFLITSDQGTSIHARVDGSMVATAPAGAPPNRLVNAPLIVDFRDVLLPKSGEYELRAILGENDAVHSLTFEVTVAQEPLFTTPGAPI